MTPSQYPSVPPSWIQSFVPPPPPGPVENTSSGTGAGSLHPAVVRELAKLPSFIPPAPAVPNLARFESMRPASEPTMPWLTLILIGTSGRPALEWAVDRSAAWAATAFVVVGMVLATATGAQLRLVQDLRAGPAAIGHLGRVHVPARLAPRSVAALAAPAYQPRTGRERASPQWTARRLGLGTVASAGLMMHGRPDPSWVAAAGPTHAAPSSLLWPVEGGWFVRGYGSGEGGYHLAVDIAGHRGAPVRASASGLVGYAGSSIRGYGNVVILIHPGGWITMYAHNDRNLVRAGQHVAAGEVIARLGSTGISRGPHVHYEFMQKGLNCSPERLFAPGIRHRDGHHADIATVTWPFGQRRPREVRCQRRRRHPRSRWSRGHAAGHTHAG